MNDCATIRLSTNERTAVIGVAGLVAVLGVLGMVNSFARVATAVAPSFGGLAWTVPLGIDVGIAVFTVLDLVLARLDMRARWLRVFPWALVGATVFLNVAGETTSVGAVAHAVLPGLWVVAVEAGAHALSAYTGLTRGSATKRLQRIRPSRWVLAPWSTARLFRRMVLWETRSYPDALVRERARLLARCDLVDAHGRLVWRWRAPRRQRVLYRLGELTPAVVLDQSAPGEPEPAPVLPPASARNGVRVTGARRPRSAAVDDVDVVAVARVVAGDLAAAGEALTRRGLVEGMRRAGHPVGNSRAGELLAVLRADQPGSSGSSVSVSPVLLSAVTS